MAQLGESVRIRVMEFDSILCGIRLDSLSVLLVRPRSLACMIGFLRVIALLIEQIQHEYYTLKTVNKFLAPLLGIDVKSLIFLL